MADMVLEPADRIDTVPGAAPARLSDQRLAESTRKLYARALRLFDEWLDGRPVCDETVAAYLVAMFERGLAPARWFAPCWTGPAARARPPSSAS